MPTTTYFEEEQEYNLSWQKQPSPAKAARHDAPVGLDQKLVARELNELSIARLVMLVALFIVKRSNHWFQLVKLNNLDERANEFHE